MSKLSDFTAVQAGLRNRIINGGMRLARVTPMVNAQSGQFADRFRYDSGTTARVGSVNFYNDSLYYSQLNVSTADTSISSSDYGQIIYGLEGYDIIDLMGTTFTLSFWVFSTVPGVYSVAFRDAPTLRSHIKTYTVSASNTWQKISLTVTGGLPTGGWALNKNAGLYISWVLASGSTYHNTTDSWLSGNFLASSSQVNFYNSTSNIFRLGSVQLELGSTATIFEQRPVSLELALCSRYLFTVPMSNFFGTGTLRTGGSSSYIFVPTATPLRNSPNLFYTPLRIYSGDTWANVSSLSFLNLSDGGFCLQLGHSSIGSNGADCILYTETGPFVADADV